MQTALKAEVNSGMTAYHRQGAVLGQIQMWSKPAVPNPFPRHGPVYIGQYFDAFKVSNNKSNKIKPVPKKQDLFQPVLPPEA